MSTPSSSSGVQLTPSDSQYTYIQNGWFGETEAMWPGTAKDLIK